MPASQAGRRGFDSRLPLHPVNQLRGPFQGPECNRVHEAPIAFSGAFTASLRRLSDVIVYTSSFASMVCPICSARTCGSTCSSFNRGTASTSHDLEICPSQADRLQLGQEAASP